ncbi:MAG: AI-2E family transporter [Marinoscillum sp.]
MNADPDPKPFDISKLAFTLVALIALVVIFSYSEAYIIPFIIALIIWFIIHELRENIQQVPWLKRHCPLWLQSTLGFVIINVVILLIAELLIVSMTDLIDSAEMYERNLDQTLLRINSIAGIDVTSHAITYIKEMDLAALASTLLDYVSAILGDAFLILIYVLFLLVEESVFPLKLQAMYPDEKRRKKMNNLFNKMDHSISRYLTLKTIVSLLTGVLSYFALLIIGVEGAAFWAILIFVLNYIPTIGSLIATLFPAVFAVVQFGEFSQMVYVLIAVGLIQVIVGNVIEPKIMGNSLNISSLVVILSLTIWGAIWGIMGMILSVPITVMMIVVFEEIPSLRPIALMLSERGKLNETEED